MRSRGCFGKELYKKIVLIIIPGVLILTCGCSKRGKETVEPTVLQADEGESHVQIKEELTSAYEYDYLESGEIIITAYLGEEPLVIVPGEIEGKQVTAIGNRAFYENYDITKVLLPEGIEEIGKEAFAKCANVEYIFLSSTVREIGERALANINGLKELSFPNEIKFIASKVCEGCISLESVYIPESAEVEGDAFEGCV